MRAYGVVLVLMALFVAVAANGCASDPANVIVVEGSDATAVTCTAPAVACGGGCVNTNTAHDNCGSCGHACGATEECTAGTCAFACASGQSVCGVGASAFCATTLMTCGDGGSAYCANAQSDNANCGTCGNACGAGKACSGGSCETTCSSSQTYCASPDAGLDSGIGACTSIMTDPKNCGGCGKSCGPSGVCSGGVCGSDCAKGFTACGGGDAGFTDAGPNDAGLSYCANLQTDTANCGAWGRTCNDCNAGSCGSVLLLGDNDDADGNALTAAIQNAGLSVTYIASGAISYTGIPAASKYTVVVLTPAGSLSGLDMPAAGQSAIVAAHNAGTGFVATEWFAFNIYQGVYATLKSIQILSRAVGSTSVGPFTYTLTTPNHPIWTGLPASFVTATKVYGNPGSATNILNGGSSIATSLDINSNTYVGVVVHDKGLTVGRTVQLNNAADYMDNNIWTNDPMVTLLTINAVKWAANAL